MIGAAASVDSEDSTVAPRKAPIAPGPAIRATTRQSTLRSRQCEMPEAMLVPSSEKCTDGGRGRRGQTGQDQQRGRGHAVTHAEAAVDELSGRSPPGRGSMSFRMAVAFRRFEYTYVDY